MKGYVLKKGVLSLALFLAFLGIEFVTYRFLVGKLLPTMWYIDIGVFFIISAIMFVLPMTLQTIFSNIFLLLHDLLCITNIILFNSSGRYFDWTMLKLAKETAGVTDMVVIPYKHVITLLLIFVFYLVGSVVLESFQKKSLYKKFIHQFIFVMSVGLTLAVVFLEAIMPSVILSKYDKDNYFTSDSFMFTSFESPTYCLNTFGFWGYYFHSLLRIIIPSVTPEIQVASSLCSGEYTSTLKGLCEGDNVVMILAESFEDYIISKATTPVLYALKNGIDLSQSGISDFYNVSVDSETGQYKLQRKDFNSDLTYNGQDIFYGLNENVVGLELTNYKSIESTKNSEVRVMSANSPEMFGQETSIAHMLGSLGYITNYVHGNYGGFYQRSSYMKGLGFDNTLFYDDMEGNIESSGELSFFLRDRDVVNYYLANEDEFDFINDEQFLTFMMTITTHGSYSIMEKTEPLMNEYLEKFDAFKSAYPNDEMIACYNSCGDDDMSYLVGNFLASAIDTEEAVALLVHELFESDKLNETIIVFVSDHYSYSQGPYTYKNKYLQEVRSIDNVRESDRHIIPAFIYSTKILQSDLEASGETRVVEHLTTAFDIVPTVLTLLGTDYDDGVYFGYPVVNREVSTGETLYNKGGYSSTNGYFFDDYFVGISGRGDDFDALNADEKSRIDVLYDYINQYYSKKYYVIEMDKRGLFGK